MGLLSVVADRLVDECVHRATRLRHFMCLLLYWLVGCVITVLAVQAWMGIAS